MHTGLIKTNKKGDTEMEFFNHLTIDHENKIMLYSYVDKLTDQAVSRLEQSLKNAFHYEGYLLLVLPKTTLEIKGEKQNDK